MTGWVAALNGLADGWGHAMFRASWQGAIAIALVWAICWAFPRIPPRVRGWLWRLVYLKLVLSIFWWQPIAELPVLPPSSAPDLPAPDRPLLQQVPMASAASEAPMAPAASTEAMPAPATAAPTRRALELPAYLLLAWLVGLLSSVYLAAVEWRSVRRLRRESAPVEDECAPRLCAELCQQLGIRRAPSLLRAEGIDSPMLMGLARPTIILPSQLLSHTAPEQLGLMLIHELAHLKRRDLLWGWLPSIAQGAFFFHPLVWLANWEFRLAQEVACDELAVLTTHTPPADYGEMLVRMAHANHPGPCKSPAAVCVIESCETLKRRLTSMKHFARVSRKRLLIAAAALLLLATIGIAPWRLVHGTAQEREDAAPEMTTRVPDERSEELAATVMPGRILARDGEEILGRRREGDGPWERVYPSPTTFCHLTGYNTKTGLQAALRGELVDAGLERGSLGELPQPARVGNDVQLTIDADGQSVAQGQLDGRKGAVVALDPRTGEVLVLASGPTYDPTEVTRTAMDFELFSADPDAPHLDRGLQGLYPPGSIFKLVTAAAALEAGEVNVDRQYTCGGAIGVGGREMQCWKQGGHGALDMAQAVAQSCNVYFAHLGIAMGTASIAQYAQHTGIFAPVVPVLPASASRIGTDKTEDLAAAHYANGQGDLLVTPLAAARLAAAIAHEGLLVDPWLVKTVSSPEADVLRRGAPGGQQQAIGESTARVLAGTMELAVALGTADHAAMRNVRVAGKTGSAENPSGAAHAWFIGFAPVDDPQVAIAVVVENGGSGGATAAPIAREVMAELLE